MTEVCARLCAFAVQAGNLIKINYKTMKLSDKEKAGLRGYKSKWIYNLQLYYLLSNNVPSPGLLLPRNHYSVRVEVTGKLQTMT